MIFPVSSLNGSDCEFQWHTFFHLIKRQNILSPRWFVIMFIICLKNHFNMKAKESKNKMLKRKFTQFSKIFTKAAGSPFATIGAMAVIFIWLLSGPLFGFSDTWQLVINTGTTIVTFLMVFIIQQSQNRDSLAIQLKLNELIAANENTSNRLVDVEDLTEDELEVLKKYYIKLAQIIKKEKNIKATHSLEEAEQKHLEKKQGK
jgi:low affinity Fe/Cu permease